MPINLHTWKKNPCLYFSVFLSWHTHTQHPTHHLSPLTYLHFFPSSLFSTLLSCVFFQIRFFFLTVKIMRAFHTTHWETGKRGERSKLTISRAPLSSSLSSLHTAFISSSLRTGTSCRWALPSTPWGCGGSGGWRTPGCELLGPLCGTGHVPGWLCWGSLRSACCARHFEGPWARDLYMQRTPAWLEAKAARAALF